MDTERVLGRLEEFKENTTKTLGTMQEQLGKLMKLRTQILLITTLISAFSAVVVSAFVEFVVHVK